MKKSIVLSIVFILTILFNKNLLATSEKGINNSITISWVSNPESVHYSQPVIAEIYNVTDSEKDYNILSGTLLQPSDENCQKLIVTNSLKGKIGPKKSIKLNVNAMCIENNKSSGRKELSYQIIPNNDSVLIALAKFIESKKYFNSEAQNTIWAWTNKTGIEDIYGEDTFACLALQQRLAQLTKRTVPTQLVKGDYERNYYVAAAPKASIGGNFEYRLSKSREVSIGIFNENGVLVRELFKQKNVSPGKHTFDYEFDVTVYTDDSYKILFILDGKIVITQPLALKEWRNEILNSNSK